MKNRRLSYHPMINTKMKSRKNMKNVATTMKSLIQPSTSKIMLAVYFTAVLAFAFYVRWSGQPLEYFWGNG